MDSKTMNIPVKHLKGFASRLLKTRQFRELTQKELGALAEIPACKITLYEHGHALPSLLHAVNLSRALDVRLDWLAQDEPAWDEPSITA